MMKLSTTTLLIFSVLVLVLATKPTSADTKPVDENWYKTSVLYQLYPRSFKDSNGDGIGDLKGVIEKLDFFVDAGITAFWLSPILKSPQVDQGYDTSDYYTVDPEYGSNEDLYELIEKAHAMGLKVLLDFVPNHTSDQHEWFNKSINREEGYEDFYVWANGTVENGIRQLPNNWVSVFGGSAWEWNDVRKQYFLHQFTFHQPDLNFRSQGVLNAFKDIMRFWLDKGIDGFRVDAIPFFVENEDLPNEHRLWMPLPNCPESEYWCIDHEYSRNQLGSFEALYGFRDFVDNYTQTVGGDPRVIISEAYADKNTTLLLYGNSDGSRLGSHYTFNFDFITYLNFNSTPRDLADIINWWQDNLKPSWTRNWVMGNHDNHRVATRLGYADAYNMLVVGFLPGVSVTYQGEELGMKNGAVNCTEGKDPKANCSNFDKIARDFERTPFQWDSSKNAGFSNASKIWLPVSKDYLSNNLVAQNITGLNSHYNIYKKSAKFHKKLAVESANNNFQEIYIPAETWANVLITYRQFEKTCQHDDPYVFVFNMNRTHPVVVDMKNTAISEVESYQVQVTSFKSHYKEGQLIGPKIQLFPQESIIVKAECAPA